MDGVSLPNIKLRGPYYTSIDHIYDELARIELLVRAQVIRWRHSAACAGPDRDWGMVLVSDTEIERYLRSPIEAPGSLSDELWEQIEPFWNEAARLRQTIDKHCGGSSTTDLRLPRLAYLFGLESPEKDVVLLCLLQEMDERYRRLCGYLRNDASLQSLSVDLISQILCGFLQEAGAARELFSPSGSLVSNRLILTGSDASSADGLSLRSVRIDDRIAAYLLGSDIPDARLAGALTIGASADPATYARAKTLKYLEVLPESLHVSLSEGSGCVCMLLLGPDQRLATKVARAAVCALGIPLFEFDVRAALSAGASWQLLLDLAYREARLSGAALFFLGGDALLAPDQDRSQWKQLELAASGFRGLTIVEADSSLCAPGAVNDAQFRQVDLPLPDYETRKQIWLSTLPSPAELSLTGAEHVQLAADLANSFQTTEAQIEDAVAGAWNLARREMPFVLKIEPDHIFEACRRQIGKRLVTFAQRIEPRRTLSIDDVILPEPNKRQLLELNHRIKFHREIFHRTGLEQSMRLGKGLLVLFAGASGTGKTMAAEALANKQRVDLYRVDLSAVVSKWIGETEKNLSRIFAEAESSNGWLFFDEGESLFGSRGDIKQAQDRMLNLEVNYLLQRIEEFSGVVILATNLRQNIDDAFLRRIHALVEFPQPSPQLRAGIWKKLTPSVKLRDFDDDQLDRLAARFDISGGNIRNVVLDAMFRASASQDQCLTMRHIVAGIAREYQKLGRPITNAEFGETNYKWVVEDILDPVPLEGADVS